MIYTFGLREAYEENLRKYPGLTKAGLKDRYGGGIAFKTAKQAKDYLREMGTSSDPKHMGVVYVDAYDVYGLDCDMSNTYIHEDGTRRIIRDATIIRLVKQPE